MNFYIDGNTEHFCLTCKPTVLSSFFGELDNLSVVSNEKFQNFIGVILKGYIPMRINPQFYKRKLQTRENTHRNPRVAFRVVIMASSIACRCVCTSRTIINIILIIIINTCILVPNMTVIFQPVYYIAYIFDIGQPCYGQFTPVKTRCNVSADQYRMTIS